MAAAMLLLNGCIVVSAATTAASVAVGAVGVAADVAIGTAKVAGKAAGAAIDAAGSTEAPVPAAGEPGGESAPAADSDKPAPRAPRGPRR